MTDRSEKLLTAILLQLMKGATLKDKISHLTMAGFTNVEIAEVLDTTTGSVAQTLYESKKTKKHKVAIASR